MDFLHGATETDKMKRDKFRKFTEQYRKIMLVECKKRHQKEEAYQKDDSGPPSVTKVEPG